ncbi:MAG: proton-conducting transporter membrane subunit, partial [Bacteroidales bacterium]|nr:proton-conducting transporter membrane subunit [Bacteroidales bacterium]
MVYIYLFLFVAIATLLSAISCRHFKPTFWGPSLAVALSAIGIALSISSLGSTTSIAQFSHPVFGKSAFICDTLSSWFLIIVSILFALGSFYGRGYLAHYKTTTAQLTLHWVAFIITLAGIFVLLTTQNLVVFLLGWEMMAIGSFFAVIFEYEHPQVLKAGLNYFIQSHIAVLLITIVFAWSISVTNSTTFDGLRLFFSQLSTTKQVIAMSLLIAGFGFKAGIVPFHSWLPLAHPAAPSHVSALMSGVIVKAGIYGILRFGTMLSGSQAPFLIGIILLILGIVSGLYGIVNAAEHRDFKRMLAYCTIENIGIICMALGIGFIGWAQSSSLFMALGFGGALLHVLNHALFKALLFFGAGNVYVSAHTRDMEQLGGLGKLMPRTAAIFLIGSLAIGGLPPIGGFLSEILIYSGFINGFGQQSVPLAILMALAGCSLAIIGGISMLAFTKTFGVIFLGTPRKQLAHQPSEVSLGMLWPAWTIIALMALTLVFPGRIAAHLFSVALSHFHLADPNALNLPAVDGIVNLVSVIGRSMLIFMLLMVLFSIVRRLIARTLPVRYANTWGCGYAKPIKGIQYTSKSFSKTLI